MTAVRPDARRTQSTRRRSQRGQAMLLVVMLVGILASLFVFGIVDTTALVLRRDQDTAAVLAQAKQALIGRAVSDDSRPGSLPCPDTNDDGVAELFVGVDCPSYIGRLPWKTLGLADLRDHAGERLWYALASAFRDNTSAGLLDSDTKGSITVYQDSMATAITTQAVALIFAPGPVLAGQVRDPASANNPANYLETTGGVNNAIATGPFISAQMSSTFNDRLLVLTTAELMPVVELRVVREMLALLSAYRANSACACYPWAANDFDDDSVTGRTRGMAPIENALPENWGSGAIPNVPGWMIGSSEWGKKFFYAVAPSQTETPAPGTLTVDGGSKNLVLITTGPAGASRPSSSLADYLEDFENRNNDDIFCQPGPSAMAPCTPTTAYARDRLYTIP